MVVEVVWLLVNFYSLSWVGLFLGLKLANPAKAAGQAIFYVVLLPWLAPIAFAAPVALVAGARFGPDLGVPSAGLFVISLAFCNSFFTVLGRQRIARQFPLLGRASLRMKIRDRAIMDNITFNYGCTLEAHREPPCRCGAPGCAGYIVAEEFFDHVKMK